MSRGIAVPEKANTTRFSTVQEVADMLRVSKMTVYRLCHGDEFRDAELPFVRVGRSMRIPTQAVWDYLHGMGISQHAIPKRERPDLEWEPTDASGNKLYIVGG